MSDVALTSTIEEPHTELQRHRYAHRYAAFQRLEGPSHDSSESFDSYYLRNYSPDPTEELTQDGTTEGGKKKKRNFLSKVFGWVGKRVGKFFKGR